MNFESITTLKSTTPGFESVSFTLRKMTEGRRNKLKLAQADTMGKIRDLMADLESLNPTLPEGIEQPTVDPKTRAKLTTISEAVNILVESEIDPSWVKHGLKKIEGLDIDGVAATVESFIEDAPTELFQEVLTAIRNSAELTVAEAKN